MTILEKLAEKNGVVIEPEKKPEERISELERENAELREAMTALLRGETV